MFDSRKKYMEPIEIEILNNPGNDALVAGFIEAHTERNMYIFNCHKEHFHGLSILRSFNSLVPKAANRNYFIQLKAEPLIHLHKLCGCTWKIAPKCKLFKCFIYSEIDAKVKLATFVELLKTSGRRVVRSFDPVNQRTIKNCMNGKSIPKFSTLMNIGLLYGFRISISIIPR